MAKLKKNALSNTPQALPENPAKTKKYFLPGTTTVPLAMAVLSLAAIFSSLTATSLGTAGPQAQPLGVQKRNFAFMLRTAAWQKNSLALNYGLTTFDLTKNLASWNRRKIFVYPPIINTPQLPASPLQNYINGFFRIGNPWTAFSDNEQIIGFDLQSSDVYNFLSETIAPKIDRSPSDAKLTIKDGRATEFVPDSVGVRTDLVKAVAEIKLSLFTGRTQTNVPASVIKPRVQLADTNQLGIRELVAAGESDFRGSSASRIQNIRVGASKFEGVILSPGEEFSFNRFLGPITSEAGFKPELVIKSSGTVPELGGGLCQVSTTSFRAALYGGLPITARKNHSYAVKYYAPQGTDATIYPGVVDFKFINDTPSFLLIHTRIEGTKLYFEYYGTKDDRTVSIDGPYQYDILANGAMNARLARTVEKDGEKTADTFFSKYVSHDLFPTVYEFPTAPKEETSPQTPPPQNESPGPNPDSNETVPLNSPTN